MISQSEQLRHFRSNYLNLIILPTEACNFRCTYCYETFENKKMPRPVVTGIKSLIDRRGADLDELDISWFGGEPLLALDVITEISKHALDVAKTEGFAFRSGMTTNGYFLDQDRFAQCLNHKIDFFQISLDGNSDEHNASRKLASGGGTFDRIWSNLIAMKGTSAEFDVLLRLHYTMENFISIGQFARRHVVIRLADELIRAQAAALGRGLVDGEKAALGVLEPGPHRQHVDQGPQVARLLARLLSP